MAEPTPEEAQRIQKTIGGALNDPTLPRRYTNGFHVGQSASDVFLVHLLGGQPTEVQYMSFNTAKTLLLHLQELITNIEKRTSQEILSQEQVHKLMESGDQNHE